MTKKIPLMLSPSTALRTGLSKHAIAFFSDLLDSPTVLRA